MGSEKRADHAHGCCLPDAAYHAQHLQLVVGVESVAAFYLHGSRAFGCYLADTLHGLVVELVFRSLVQPVRRAQYAATPAGYLGVAQAAYLVDELALATARIHQVGVAVAERREQPAPLGIDSFSRSARHSLPRYGAQPVVLASEVGNVVVLGEQPRVVNARKVLHFAAPELHDGCVVGADNACYVSY